MLDREFLAQHTHGFEEIRTFIDATDWARIEHESGLPRDAMEQAAQAYIRAKSLMSA